MTDVKKLTLLFGKYYGRIIKTELKHRNPLQLLVSTILAAQCTDARVNIVTKSLFKKYRTAKDFAKASLKTFEQEVRSTGFYKNKAKNIIAAARMIESDFNGKVPKKMEELIKLPGVGRKTANIVLVYGYGIIKGIPVDTHVARLSYRLDLTKSKNPTIIERELMEQIPEKDWLNINYWLVSHGRLICQARKPMCDRCVLNKLCPKVGVK